MSETYFDRFFADLEKRYAGQNEFLQAVREVLNDVCNEIHDHKEYERESLLQRLAEADRIISFRVSWQDDQGAIHVNRGWRVQHSNLIGPYKGGLRFHPSVTESVLKFLAFEQMFKNALTGMGIGGAKGGSDFDPRGRSDREIMRFCNAFMDELYRHIGDNIDVPAGDINVGSREIGYLFGHYRRLANNFSGVLTGKDIEFGGSHVRLEATGFGLIYFVRNMLENLEKSLKDCIVVLSGSGNVAIYAAIKAVELGAQVITLSSSQGYLQVAEGFRKEELQALLKAGGDSTERLQSLGVGKWIDDQQPWQESCDIALPCATENELDKDAARYLVEGGCWLVAEGANMPCTEGAIDYLEEHQVLHAPGKASNAGGVAVSALEMGQNRRFLRRGYDELNVELEGIMKTIHQQCVDHAPEHGNGFINYRRGANRAAFRRIRSALLAQGVG
ncbi:MAG: NADP-specific glutamate dehydrogenase [Gammaproteobacteria bacterium]